MKKEKVKSPKYKRIHRDLSWLSFNERVLQEAEDIRVPLIERLRFLGIYSNNQDEFFRVRVATLKRMARIEKLQMKEFEFSPTKIIHQIQKKVLVLKNRFDELYLDLLQECKKENIFILNEKELNATQGALVKRFFIQQVRSKLFPIMIDQVKKLPVLSDKSIYLAVALTKKNGNGFASNYSLIEVPDINPLRFFVLPESGDKKFVILLDDVIRYNLPQIFQMMDYDSIESYTIKITRDAELELDMDLSQSLLEVIQKSVKKRGKGEPVRFIYDAEMPVAMLDFFSKKMKLQKGDAIIPGARYHNFKDFMNFPDLGRNDLCYKKDIPIAHPLLLAGKSVFSVLQKKDIMLHPPYQSFDHIIDFLREAAIRSSVTHIYMSLYRVAKDSSVVMALINAARNGKNVTVVMELQARFDEENNIFYAHQMEEEGVKVIFGLNNLKVHAKLCLVVDIENRKQKQYGIVGTGNYNENTAKVYTDIFLLTAKPEITKEIKQVFTFFENQFAVTPYKNLILAPMYMRQKLKQLISREMKNAKVGKQAEIFIKVNNLADSAIIKKLYNAGKAGVKVRLIVRSVCSIVTEVNNLSDNIQARSILDKFLEHPRIFMFANGGKSEIFIGSADIMERNLDFRVEVMLKVLDEEIKKQITDIMELQWKDNMKARNLSLQYLNEYIPHEKGTELIRSQKAIYDYFTNYFDNTVNQAH
ncbi:MAG: polyphosphate kinase 1 [Chitinophagales bacterium]|nr:polyphosphate kinase 1 [Bacteroidota bacterium]MBP7398993.1 polyphosphate kinase 1 [Chitinophagales bacterium]MBK8682119.1 polyphosphate kinase 1 [Bacteroidota bacterium]MBP8753244.1 polyphosphate kinase 1 [Chitinophagales bacterium]MBP9189394.1 polyphosphate kinase 1 [Chitinophagales bacterium]